MTRSSTPPIDVPALALETPMVEFFERDYPTYLELVRQAEDHADNSPGADKSWVERGMRDYQQHYRRATRGS